MSAEVIDIDPYSDRTEWLERRQKGLGASDAAAALGLSPWVTPYALWAKKALGVTDDEQSEPMYWGMALEPVILDRYKSERPDTPVARATGFFMSVERKPRCDIHSHPRATESYHLFARPGELGQQELAV